MPKIKIRSPLLRLARIFDDYNNIMQGKGIGHTRFIVLYCLVNPKIPSEYHLTRALFLTNESSKIHISRPDTKSYDCLRCSRKGGYPEYTQNTGFPFFIEDEEAIEKILKHPGLWDLKVRPPPKVKASSVTISIDDSDSQVPFSAPPFYPDPDYPMDSYVN